MKKIVILIIILFIVGVVGYKYIYKAHRNIETEKAAFKVQSSEIVNEFSLNIENATNKYLNKTIEVSGIITDIKDNIIMLDHKIVCYMLNTTDHNLILNSEVIIKGRFIGYDELLEEFKIDQCKNILIK